MDAATTGLDGLQMMLTQEPDVLILDLGLPDVSGERLLGMIRAVTQTPVIVATARDDEGLIVRLLDEGADDYLVKPYSPNSSRRDCAPCCVAPGPRSTMPPQRCGSGAWRSIQPAARQRSTASRWI